MSIRGNIVVLLLHELQEPGPQQIVGIEILLGPAIDGTDEQDRCQVGPLHPGRPVFNPGNGDPGQTAQIPKGLLGGAQQLSDLGEMLSEGLAHGAFFFDRQSDHSY